MRGESPSENSFQTTNNKFEENAVNKECMDTGF